MMRDLFNHAPHCDLCLERNLLNFLQNADSVCKHERKEGKEGGRGRSGRRESVLSAQKSRSFEIIRAWSYANATSLRRRHDGGVGDDAVGGGAVYTEAASP